MWYHPAVKNTLACIALLTALLAPGACTAGYPKIANLWGTLPSSIGTFSSADYDEWAKFDLLVGAGGPLDQWREASKQLRSRNPRLLILKTQNLNILGGSPTWMRDEWYLRRPDGSQVVWWAGQGRRRALLQSLLPQLLLAGAAGALDFRGAIDGCIHVLRQRPRRRQPDR